MVQVLQTLINLVQKVVVAVGSALGRKTAQNEELHTELVFMS
jgi:hypothetical protein